MLIDYKFDIDLASRFSKLGKMVNIITSVRDAQVCTHPHLTRVFAANDISTAAVWQQ